MSKIVNLTVEDCYCDLDIFYERIAQKAGYNTDDSTQFDCRKVCVTRDIQDVLIKYYREEKSVENEEMGSILLCFGPKANLDGEMTASVEDGFI